MHPCAVVCAVGPDGMDEDAAVSCFGFARGVCLFAPAVFGDEVVVFVFVDGGEAAPVFA